MSPLIHIANKHANEYGSSKAESYYEVYQDYFQQLTEKKLNILEVGTCYGQGAKLFSEYFSNSKIVTIDIDIKEINFSEHPNISYVKCDQGKKEELEKVVAEHFSDGIDIVIEDGGHYGRLSKRTFDYVFPHVKSGGFYVVEDWGTGYWKDWADGMAYQDIKFEGRKIISHDFGMVGFVKSLIDEVGASDIKPDKLGDIFIKTKKQTVKYIHYYPGLVIMKKL